MVITRKKTYLAQEAVMNIVKKIAQAVPVSLMVTAIAAAPSLAGTLKYASEAYNYNEGFKVENYGWLAGDDSFDRTDINNALGDDLTNFTSLGKTVNWRGEEGSAIFGFGDKGFTGEVKIWEATNESELKNRRWDETIEVWVGTDLNNFFLLGDIYNQANYDAGNTLSVVNPVTGKTSKDINFGSLFTTDLYGDEVFKYLKVVDKSTMGGGFDLASVAVEQSVPEPSTILGLLAVGSLGASFLKRKQQKL